jgi:hypothetical protein
VVAIEGDAAKAALAVRADAGWHLFNGVDFAADARGVTVTIDLEGHNSPVRVAKHAAVDVVPAKDGESSLRLITRALASQYPQASRPQKKATPDWWRRPIYCGWGDQVTCSMWNERVGPEPRALAYCTQGLYERWIDRLDEAGVPFGTITIDAGWSPAGDWQPYTDRWPDLRGFIDRQHAKGRRVLLWLATWLWDGLPPEWCATINGERLVADPSHPAYLKRVREQVTRLISPRGFNADGFKIDQLAYSPRETQPFTGKHFGRIFPAKKSRRDRIKLHGKGYGCELLHRLQKTIYDAAHDAKRDALVSSSTVHPYFHDTLDMVRIHDMGHVAPDIFAAMRARVDLAHAALPGKVIDTDDWIHSDYEMWMRYTSGSHALGVPCIFYAERFMKDWQHEPATQEIPLEDLRRIADAWRSAGF